MEQAVGTRASALLEEATQILGVGDLRTYVYAQFFETHLQQYTKSRRSAPIYLPLTSTAGDYSIWLYLHRLGSDTLFTVHGDIVVPKLRMEESRLEHLRQEAVAGAQGRKQIEQQEVLVDALREMAEETRRVAPLWRPNLDDGVLVSFAPLWRLFPQHRSWQKDLKSTWDSLCAGDYDWAHLAMHLWPERVVPKCTGDRSLAIAHGLENEFWVEGTGGKWMVRTKPVKSVDEFVKDRSSPAVKAALKSLLEAPTNVASAKRGGTTKRGKSK